MYKLVLVPNKVLTSKAKHVKVIDGAIRSMIKEMDETLVAQTNPVGVGLAAPQVGIDLAIFLMKPTPKSHTEIIINPKIVETVYEPSEEAPEVDETQLEGCLSIPRIWSPVKRAQKIQIEYQSLDGVKQKKWFTGFKAVIVQHEIDHLNGILFTQRALEQNSTLYEEKGGTLVPREI